MGQVNEVFFSHPFIVKMNIFIFIPILFFIPGEVLNMSGVLTYPSSPMTVTSFSHESLSTFRISQTARGPDAAG